MLRWISGIGKSCKFPSNHDRNLGFRYSQRYSLVNVKLTWVKDNVLDSVVTGERELRAAWVIVSTIAADPGCCLPIYRLSGRRRGQLGLPEYLKVSTFMRKYPNIFSEFHLPDTGGTLVPWFRLSPHAIELHQESMAVFNQNQRDFLDRITKLLLLTKNTILPLQTIDQLKWDLGLPHDYLDSIVTKHQNIFSLINLPDSRLALKLISKPDTLPLSQLQKNAIFQKREDDVRNNKLSFKIGFPRGFGLNKKSIKWLDEWQMLPYTSPYSDSSDLDPRTDVSEKRIVGVFHELLNLTIEKKTDRKNVSNLRKPLNLPQKFTKVFERHPGIFYISKKNNTQTVVLREAYDGHRIVEKHPVSEIRNRFGCLMKEGFLDKSRGLYKKKEIGVKLREEDKLDGVCENGFKLGEESEGHMFSEYESDETAQLFRLCD
ncbi:hypothetical protein LXL04_027401 [Taraxacum kok-saghyz]